MYRHKQRLKEKLAEYLEAKGINVKKNFRCLDPAHEDRDPSMSYYAKGHVAKCFACGRTYDIFSLVGLDYGLSGFPEQYAKACELFGLREEKAPRPRAAAPKGNAGAALAGGGDGAPGAACEEFFAACEKRLLETAYWRERGLSEATARRFRLGFDPAWRSPRALAEGGRPPATPRLIIPTGPSSYVARAAAGGDARYRYQKEGPAQVFNLASLREAEAPVFVVEGELDAMSVVEAGGEAVALGSVSMAARFVEQVRSAPPRRPLVVALDADPAGQRAQAALLAALAAAGVPAAAADLTREEGDPGGRPLAAGAKDANGVLTAPGGKGLLAAAVQAAAARAEGAAAERQEKARAEYLRDSAGAWLDQFFVAAKEEAAAPVPSTGFYRLDRALGGGLFPGLYGVGAISGAGKTSLAMQMADAVARGGGHALVFSLEMGRFDLMAKSLSRLTAEKWAAYSNRPLKKALTARQILGMYRDGGLGAEQRAEVMAAAQAYSAFSGRVVIQECLGDLGAEQIRQRVQQHCALFGAPPVVFVDYLQIMAPVDVHLTDKQNMDRTVLELKRISRDFHTPVMAISSLNRLNYSRSINMEAYKESGAIEYSCDVLLGLQLQGQGNEGFDLEAAMRASPRRVELKILKNRAGMPFDSVRFDFYPQFNFFARVPGEADDE